jgi:hypothetical protein
MAGDIWPDCQSRLQDRSIFGGNQKVIVLPFNVPSAAIYTAGMGSARTATRSPFFPLFFFLGHPDLGYLRIKWVAMAPSFYSLHA